MKNLHKLTYDQRQQELRQYFKKDFENIFNTFKDNKNIEGFNVENMIGGTKVPLGVAGPAKFRWRDWENQDYQQSEILIPLATTEGALVASINRGLKLLNFSDVKAVTQYMGATRGPFIQVKNIDQAQQIIDFLEKNPKKIQKWVSRTSKHTQYRSFTWQTAGQKLYLRFIFDTQVAMGMNMVTIATEEILKNLSVKFGLRKTLVSGNFCVDKKPSMLNIIQGRGRKVWVESKISEDALMKHLKINGQDLIDTIQNKQIYPSLLTGTLAANAQAANVAAALFLATGQDLGHIVEASSTFVQVEKMQNTILLSIYMPAVMVGSLGGGMRLGSQKQAMRLMGIEKPSVQVNNFLAVSLGVAILAGEISLTAALINQTLAKSHQKLARNEQI